MSTVDTTRKEALMSRLVRLSKDVTFIFNTEFLKGVSGQVRNESGLIGTVATWSVKSMKPYQTEMYP